MKGAVPGRVAEWQGWGQGERAPPHLVSEVLCPLPALGSDREIDTDHYQPLS